MNICSAVVHARPEKLGVVQSALEEFNGVEVHGSSEQGKLVVTVEGRADDTLADTLAKFSDVDGVVNTVMIYHYCGEETLDEEANK